VVFWTLSNVLSDARKNYLYLFRFSHASQIDIWLSMIMLSFDVVGFAADEGMII
jgi:hypothetical protein